MEYCYVVPAGDELYHYGVKGMHWGVRRYQNQDGSPTSKGRARMKEWKAKEIKRRTKFYNKQNDKLNKKLDKLNTKKNVKIIKGRDTNKLDAKIKAATMASRISNAMKSAEVKKIKSMKMYDIRDAKINKAKTAVKKSLSIIGGAALGTAMTTQIPILAAAGYIGEGIAGEVGGLAAIAGTQIGGAAISGKAAYKLATVNKAGRYSNLTKAEKAKIYTKYYK